MQKRRIKIFNKGENDLPNYATELSAGFDIRVDLSRVYKIEDLIGNSEYFTLYTTDSGAKSVTLFPNGGRVLIPTGLYVAIPDGYELEIRPRSGLSLKNGITIANSPGTVDADYRGEIGLIVINTDPKKPFEIKHGERLAQGLLKEVEQIEWEQVYSIEELGDTVRGQGGFNSTGTK